MKIDAMMNRFRLASRELFNHYYFANGSEDAWLLEERFFEVEALLFQTLVTEPAGIDQVKYRQLQPQIGVELRHGDFAPWMLNREADSGYWDFPVEEVTRDAVLKFVAFFDWDQVDYHDNRYVRVLVESWPSHPEANGKHALIESLYVRFTQA